MLELGDHEARWTSSPRCSTRCAATRNRARRCWSYAIRSASCSWLPTAFLRRPSPEAVYTTTTALCVRKVTPRPRSRAAIGASSCAQAAVLMRHLAGVRNIKLSSRGEPFVARWAAPKPSTDHAQAA